MRKNLHMDWPEAADSLTLEQMLEFKRLAEAAHNACRDLVGSEAPMCLEAVSDYFGMSFSYVVEELENLACALDSRIDELSALADQKEAHDA